MDTFELGKAVVTAISPVALRVGLGSPVEFSLGHADIHVAFPGHDVGLELVIELQDFFIYALVYSGREGRPPIGYEDDRGNRVKVHLQRALERLGISVTEEAKRLQGLGGDHRNWKQMTEIISGWVDRYWPTIVLRAKELVSV